LLLVVWHIFTLKRRKSNKSNHTNNFTKSSSGMGSFLCNS